MGNTGSSSGKHSQSHNIRDETVDFGYLSPQGIYTGPQDWNQEIVGKLIIDRKLAPFYRPLEDYEPDWNDEAILRNRKLKSGEESLPPPMIMTVSGPSQFSGKSSIKGKGVADRREQQRMSEAEVYHGAIECPICFMYYPPNINHSRCCDQAICTECFVQIKRNEPTTTHIVSEPAACPYCVQENFGVIYEPPSWRAGLVLNTSGSRPELPRLGGSAVSSGSADSQGRLTADRPRRKSVPHQAGEVVTIDYIRPDWEAKLEAVRAAVARRANRRIIMRQVGDRLIPVGITSGRVVPVNIAEGDANGGGRRSRRQRNGGSSELPTMTGHDLEELMMMEAMRLSLLEHEAHQRREREAQAATQGADSAPPREAASAFSGLQQHLDPNQRANAESSLSVASAGLPPSSGSSTPLQGGPPNALELASDGSSAVSPRQSFEVFQAGSSSHRRVGSGPIQVASSPLNGAAAIAMAFGFPTTPDETTPGNVHPGQSGFPPGTLNTLSAAVSTSSIPAAILGASSTDRPEIELDSHLAPRTGNTQTSRDGTAYVDGLERLVAGDASPPVQEITPNTAPASPSPQLHVAHVSKPTSHPDNTSDPSVVSPSMDASSPAPVAERDPGFGNLSSVTFLTADARTATDTSVHTAESHGTYSVLPSSPDTETDQPLIPGPPKLARFDTGDSHYAQLSPGSSNAV